MKTSVRYKSGTVAIDIYLHFEYSSLLLKYVLPFPLVPATLIGDYFDNKRYGINKQDITTYNSSIYLGTESTEREKRCGPNKKKSPRAVATVRNHYLTFDSFPTLLVSRFQVPPQLPLSYISRSGKLIDVYLLSAANISMGFGLYYTVYFIANSVSSRHINWNSDKDINMVDMVPSSRQS
jgi:hypothetical protein